MNHLTEKQLIEYQFELIEGSYAGQIELHLKDCAQCRKHLERLKRKFSALDLLKRPSNVSKELINKTIAGAKFASIQKTSSFAKAAWIASAAAVLVIGSLLFISDVPRKIIYKSGAPVAGNQKPKPDAQYEGNGIVFPVKQEREIGEAAADSAAFGIPEEPPFAPASAIELVILPRIEDVQLTIYNSADLTLVRQSRNLTLKKGWNWLQFMWANTLIDPTSLEIRPTADTDKILVQQLVFPARLKDIGRWLIRSEITGSVPFEITYFTSGLSWRAFYTGTLSDDEKSMAFTGCVHVQNNSGEDYENAQTRLIVGKVHILDRIAELAQCRYPYDSPLKYTQEAVISLGVDLSEREGMAEKFENADRWSFYAYGGLDKKQIIKEGLSEYFLYTIEGTETIPDKWAKRLESLDAENIPVKSLYKYDEDRYGTETVKFVSFANDAEHKLGETPIPDGNVKIYRQLGPAQNLTFVGSSDIKYIPVNEEIELNLGSDGLVTIEPKLMDYGTENYTFDTKGNIDGWDEINRWKIEIVNTRSSPVDIEITRNFGTNCWDIDFTDSSINYEKHYATHARLKTTLAPRSKRAVDYTLRTYHGRREQNFDKDNPNQN